MLSFGWSASKEISMRQFAVAAVAAVAVLGATLLWAAPAGATNCRDWDRASPAMKTALVENMISSAISGNRGREYQVNRGQIERCLQRSAQNIGYDFDDACADSRSAGMQALNNIFKNYIWSCVN
jgi:hypothetical protein